LLLLALLLMATTELAAQTPVRFPSAAIELEMLTRAERRSEALHAQLLELNTREVYLKASIEGLDYRMRSDNIQKELQYIGSPRPMDEFRHELRTWLERSKERVYQQIDLLNSTRARVEAELREAEAERLQIRKRLRLCSEVEGCEEGN
jgi:hypothetical protein